MGVIGKNETLCYHSSAQREVDRLFVAFRATISGFIFFLPRRILNTHFGHGFRMLMLVAHRWSPGRPQDMLESRESASNHRFRADSRWAQRGQPTPSGRQRQHFHGPEFREDSKTDSPKQNAGSARSHPVTSVRFLREAGK